MATTALSKWGNSVAIRIPYEFLKKLGVGAGNKVDLKIVEGSIVIEPVPAIPPEGEIDVDLLLGDVDCHYTFSEEERQWLDMAPKGAEIW
jgi:antitoxin component of MazEF toxin-antitoxin module